MKVLRPLCMSAAALIGALGFAQDRVEGEVTYVTANNVYVRFTSTATITPGDTLFVVKTGGSSPCLIVQSKSSSSCVSTLTGGCSVAKNDRVYARTIRSANASVAVQQDSTRAEGGTRERIRGRVSAASYSTIDAERGDDHRLMYRFALSIDHIRNSRFSAETYVNYRQLYPSEPKAFPQQTEYFNVYSLALSYAPDSATTIAFGRKINNNAASIGAIDGLQAERSFGHFFAGAIAGSRPDIHDYGLESFTPSVRWLSGVGHPVGWRRFQDHAGVDATE